MYGKMEETKWGVWNFPKVALLLQCRAGIKGQKRSIKEIRGKTVSLGLRWRDALLGVCSEAEKEEIRMAWVHKSC